MDHDLFLPKTKLFTDFRFWGAKKKRGINKIRNHRNLLFRTEHPDRLLLQLGRNSRNPVGLVDGKPDHILHPPVGTHNRYIRAMQRRCQLETFRCGALVLKHLTGKHGAQGMRNRIMGMNDIKLFIIRRYRQFLKQGQESKKGTQKAGNASLQPHDRKYCGKKCRAETGAAWLKK